MRHVHLLLGCSLFAAASAALGQAPTPPVAPPTPQPGQAEPLTQDQPPGIAPSPDSAATKPAKWDVNARHGPGRDVAIDTRSGTWMSLDVSPDGREVAFDLLGDLYTVPIGGGEARAISTGHAWDMQPRYSPDGNEIAFTSDRGGGDNIWTVRRDGSAARQITKEDFTRSTRPTGRPTAITSSRASILRPRARWDRARCGSTIAAAATRATACR